MGRLGLGGALALAAMVGWLGGCFSIGGGAERPDFGDGGLSETDWEDDSQPHVGIGVPDEETGIRFEPLEAGGLIPLETFGQGGTHASLLIRCKGFGQSAFVDIELENLATGETVNTAPATRPMLLLCHDDGTCDSSPMYVMTGALADPEEREGLRVRVTAVVTNEEGLSASASQEGVLNKR